MLLLHIILVKAYPNRHRPMTIADFMMDYKFDISNCWNIIHNLKLILNQVVKLENTNYNFQSKKF
jgi:hypothetical protein